VIVIRSSLLAAHLFKPQSAQRPNMVNRKDAKTQSFCLNRSAAAIRHHAQLCALRGEPCAAPLCTLHSANSNLHRHNAGALGGEFFFAEYALIAQFV
jgi:hypothetical protein